MIAVTAAVLSLAAGPNAVVPRRALPLACVFPTPPSDGSPTPSPECTVASAAPSTTAAGPLKGPATIVVGSQARFSVQGTGGESTTLCYRPGTARATCMAAGVAWWVKIRPGKVQYFTVHESGHTVGRLIYRNGKRV